MPLKGNIRDFSTTQILNLVNLSQKSGMLTIYEGLPTDEKDAMGNPKMAAGDERARITFHQGKLVHASMKNQDGSLVAILNKAGKLSNEQARLLRERAGNTSDKGLAMRLIGAKYVSQADILLSIKQHIMDIVFNLMTWTEGPFLFDDEAQPDKDVIMVPIDLETVIIEGSRKVRELDELNKVIENLDASLRFAENAKVKIKGIHLTVDEWKIIPYVDPKNTIRQIMKVVNMSELQIKRVIYGLNQAGLVEIVNAGARADDKKSLPTRRTTARKPAAPEKKVVLSLIEKLKSM